MNISTTVIMTKTQIATQDWVNLLQAGSNWMTDAEVLDNKKEWSAGDYLLFFFRSLNVISYSLKTADSTKALLYPDNQ